jgi:hypothetical protein
MSQTEAPVLSRQRGAPQTQVLVNSFGLIRSLRLLLVGHCLVAYNPAPFR